MLLPSGPPLGCAVVRRDGHLKRRPLLPGISPRGEGTSQKPLALLLWRFVGEVGVHEHTQTNAWGERDTTVTSGDTGLSGLRLGWHAGWTREEEVPAPRRAGGRAGAAGRGLLLLGRKPGRGQRTNDLRFHTSLVFQACHKRTATPPPSERTDKVTGVQIWNC